MKRSKMFTEVKHFTSIALPSCNDMFNKETYLNYSHLLIWKSKMNCCEISTTPNRTSIWNIRTSICYIYIPNREISVLLTNISVAWLIIWFIDLTVWLFLFQDSDILINISKWIFYQICSKSFDLEMKYVNVKL